MQDTFDGSESLVNGPSHADRVKHVLMSVGMNYPSERVLLFAPSFRKASRASRYVRHAVLARCMPRVMFIPFLSLLPILLSILCLMLLLAYAHFAFDCITSALLLAYKLFPLDYTTSGLLTRKRCLTRLTLSCCLLTRSVINS